MKNKEEVSISPNRWDDLRYGCSAEMQRHPTTMTEHQEHSEDFRGKLMRLEVRGRQWYPKGPKVSQHHANVLG